MDGLKRAASYCILDTGEEYLLLRRGKSKTNMEDWANNYIPIGGKLEACETPEDACIREVKEETGINIQNPTFFGILTETSTNPKYNWVIYFFYANIEKQSLIDCNEGDLEWIAKTKIGSIPIPTIDQVIYEYVARKQKFILSANYDEKLILLSAFEYLENKKIDV